MIDNIPLFDTKLNWIAIQSLNFDISGYHKIKIYVYRNHMFEVIESVLNKFLNFSKINADFFYGPYDDSFCFKNFNKDLINIDIVILWIDFSKYKNIDIRKWIISRLSFLRKNCKCKILLYHTGEIDLSDIDLLDVVIWNICNIKHKLGDSKTWEKDRIISFGSRLSGDSMLYVAREIGFTLIPSLVFSRLKAVIVDLDNTIYNGVLAEDGIDYVKANLILQKKIKELKESGVFIALASKNNELDVRELFEKRKDFLLRWSDFAAQSINWNDKAENILSIANKLNISTNSCLFIDDNIGEVENVKLKLPDINVILATSEERTVECIDFFPRLFKAKILNEDKLRTSDAIANMERARLSASLNEKEYFKKLGITLTYELNTYSKIQRISELLRKTNQFIFSYRRYSEKEIADFMKNENFAVICVSMSDWLSDSGVICVIIASKNKSSQLIVEELVISCRALGRKIEDIMIFEAIRFASEKLRTSKTIIFPYVKGEKNNAAIKWISEFTGSNLLKNRGKIRSIIKLKNQKYVKNVFITEYDKFII